MSTSANKQLFLFMKALDKNLRDLWEALQSNPYALGIAQFDGKLTELSSLERQEKSILSEAQARDAAGEETESLKGDFMKVKCQSFALRLEILIEPSEQFVTQEDMQKRFAKYVPLDAVYPALRQDLVDAGYQDIVAMVDIAMQNSAAQNPKGPDNKPKP